MFISFEGPEGAGKTTQVQRFADKLMSRGVDVVTTRQPGGEELGKSLRALLLDQTSIDVDPMAELLMMMADRAQSVNRLIRPALRRGAVVVCDRYIDSSVAYQGYGRGIGVEMVDTLNEIATAGLKPDLTLFLDLDPIVGLQRQQDRNRMEKEGRDFHERVYHGYLSVARAHPQRIHLVDASRSEDDVAEAIWRIYEAYHRRCP